MPCHYAPVSPGADSGQRTKTEIGGAIFGSKNGCSTRPWGRRALIPLNGSCLLVIYLGHSASVLRDSAVYCQKLLFLLFYPQKDAKTKRTFHGVSRYFHQVKVPTKVDGAKPSLIWTQRTWKSSPRSIGFDADDENGQFSRRAL